MPEGQITDRLAAGETLLLDGGTGSELQRRGADVLKGATERLEAWSATANIEFADVVRQVHQDYLRVANQHPSRGPDITQLCDYSPSRLAEFAHEWKEMGAQIIGGCCASGPEHIMAMRPVVKGDTPSARSLQ